jgi:hypothetical protein
MYCRKLSGKNLRQCSKGHHIFYANNIDIVDVHVSLGYMQLEILPSCAPPL